MEAHDALERVDRMHGEHGHRERGDIATPAAITVAVLAAFLAIATFLSNEAIKEVITKETKGADATAQFESNDVKTTIAEANSVLLRVVGTGNPKEAAAVAKAQKLEHRIETEFAPVDARLKREIAAGQTDRARADQKHLLYEVAEVGLQVGIVLAGISILARRRWLLAGGAAMGAAGVGVLISGFVY
jgi:hypothetical protein